MEIQRWVTPEPTTLTGSDTIGRAVGVMKEQSIGAILVVDGKKLAGIFTERDLVRAFSDNNKLAADSPISRFMTSDPVACNRDDDYNTVYMMMKTHQVRHIPVVENGEPVGIVSIRDLTQFYQHTLESDFAQAREEIESLKKLIHLSTDEVLDTLFKEINRYKELSVTDHLTGLYNKRYFMMRLNEETARAIRYKQDLSLVFCDLDHFKQINDNYGHDFGDLVLKEIGSTLSGGMGDLNVVSRLRKSDIVARYGGEEFVAILPETAPRNACIAAEKMRTTIEKRSIDTGNESVNVTMSFGVSGLDADVGDTRELIRRADHAMYRAKQGGRNRVEIYDPAVDRSAQLHPAHEG